MCLDLYHPQADGFWEDADEYLDLLDSLCLAFLERGERFRVVWQEGESQGLREQSVESEEDVYGLLGSLFGHGPIKQNFLWRRGSQSSVPRQPHPFCTAWT